MESKQLPAWRRNSPFFQATIVCLIVFCCSGMNSTIIGLGAGGSRVEMLPFVNKIMATGMGFTAMAAAFGGSCTNKLGPRITLLIATSGYPSFVACLWLLDLGLAKWYAWVATFWHGISAATLYPACGYILSAYSPEHLRGRYVTSMWVAALLGNVIGSCIVLGITSTTGTHRAGVPTSVYASILAIQSLGFFISFLIAPPQSIRRDDGRAIAHFKLLTWTQELRAMGSSFLNLETLLLAVSLLAVTMPFTLMGAMNSFFFSARTRALANVCYSTSSLAGSLMMAWGCDWSFLGRRRRRALILGTATLLVTIVVFTALFWFIGTHPVNRKAKGPKIDWTDSSNFLGLLGIFLVLGFAYALYMTYHIWLCSSFSNEPSKLGRQYGYLTSVRMTGMAVTFGLDSVRIPFMTEAQVYFIVMVVGAVLALVSAYRYLKDTKYGEEEGVIVPKEYENVREGTVGVGSGRAGGGEGDEMKNGVVIVEARRSES